MVAYYKPRSRVYMYVAIDDHDLEDVTQTLLGFQRSPCSFLSQ